MNNRFAVLCAGLVVVGSLTGALPLTGCDQQLTDAQYVERARDLRDKGEFQSSMIALKNALQQNPANTEARSLLGQLYVEIGDGASAEKELRQALTQGMSAEAVATPLAKSLLLQGKYADLQAIEVDAANLSPAASAEYYALQGRAFLARNKVAEAANAVALAVNAKPDSPAALVGQALLAARREQWAEADAFNDRALAADPRLADAWSLKGQLRYRQGELAKAEEAYSKAIENRVNPTPELLKRAMIRIDLQNYPGAQQDIGVLRTAAPNYPGGHFAEGRLYYAQQRFADAQTAFEQELKNFPNDVQTFYFLGLTHLAQNQLQQAEDYLKKVQDLAPRSDQVAKLIAQVYLRRKAPDRAEAALRPVLQRAPTDPEAVNLMAAVRLAQGDITKGVDYLQQSVNLQPDDAAGRLQLGLGLLEKGDTQQGFKELEKASRSDPEVNQADLVLILNYLRNQQVAKAFELASKLAQQAPDKPLPHSLLGVVYLAKGEDAKARAEFEQTLKLQPSFWGAEMYLARLDLKAGNRDAAKARYRRVLDNQPGHVDALLSLANLNLQDGKSKEALELLQQGRQKNPTSLEIGAALAQQRLAVGDRLDAIAIAQDLADQYPNDPVALRALGMTQLASGDAAKSIASFSKLTELQARSPEVWQLLGAAQILTQDYPAAAKSLEQALALDANYLPALSAKVELYLRQQDYKGALDSARRIQSVYPAQNTGYAWEGEIYARQRDYAKAAAAFQTAYGKAPNAALARRIATLAELAGDNAAAAKYAQLAASTQAAQPGAAHPMLEQADAELTLKRLRARDYEQAGKAAEELVSRAPDSPTAHSLLGLAHLAQGRNEQARDAFQQALKLNPQFSFAELNMASLEQQSGDQQGADTRYRRVLERHARQPEVLLGMTRLLDQGGRSGPAQEVLERAWRATPNSSIGLELAQHYAASQQSAKMLEVARQLHDASPNDPAVLRALGLALLAAQQHDEALTYLRRLTELQPHSAEAWGLLAGAGLRIGDDKLAEDALQKTLALQGNYLPGLVTQAQLRLKQKRFPEALQIAKKLQTTYPDASAGYRLEGDIYLLQGEFAKAAGPFQTAYAKAPDGDLAQRLSLVQYNLNKPEAAVEWLRRWLTANPADSATRLRLAGLLGALDQSAAAAAEYQRLLEQEPYNAEALNSLARLYQQTGDARSLELAERARAAAPDRPDITATLGWILVDRDQAERGLPLLQQAAAQTPAQAAALPTIRYQLAVAYAKVGRKDDARRTLEELLKNSAAFPERAAAQTLLKQVTAE